MLRSKLVLTAMLALTAAAAVTAAPRSLERAMETNTEAVYLPLSAPATIDARGCLQCPSVRLEIPGAAQFFIGADEVTLAELRQYALGKRYDMVIFYELEAPTVRRIVVAGVLPQRQ